MRRLVALVGVLSLACGGTPAAQNAATPTARPTPSPSPTACQVREFSEPATRAVVQLANGGSFTITFRTDKAPNTVRNFANIARSGCYDGLTFHRVEPNFVIQGGDPLGNGTGGGTQATELNDLPFLKGAVGIARGGDIRVSNRYQFYVCTGQCRHLDNQYTNFGSVTDGQNVADAVRVGDRIRTITIQ